MSGASIDKKINKAFKIVGRKVGWQFNKYRPDSYIDPLADRNFIGVTNLAFSQDDSFSKNPEDVLAYFKLYCDYADILPGDIFDNPEQSRTFIVLDNIPLRGPVGVASTHRVKFLRPVYTPTADKKTTFQEIALNVPVALETIGSISDAGALQSVNSKMSGSQTRVSLWTWLPVGFVKLNDVVEMSGARYLIQDVRHSTGGVEITALSMKASV